MKMRLQVIAENKECGKAWMQRGECNIILRKAPQKVEIGVLFRVSTKNKYLQRISLSKIVHS